MSAKMKYVPVSEIWNFEPWGTEMGGLIHALSITVDAITDGPNSDSAENEALYGILCTMLRLKREYEQLYHDVTSSAVELPAEPKTA